MVVMGKYNGPARVIADGVPYKVTAQLVSFTEYKTLLTDPFDDQEHVYGGQPRWIGTIHARTTTDVWRIRQTDNLLLSTEQGWEARVFIVRSDAGPGSTELRIAGTGSPPFADEEGT
ncbi:hypothetical protein ABZ281_04065 [Streptomyces sp. NPDC006265]|uniref:hypothetical protein n=1 Tax=Streptomyces sp. NPDC006265 TaxID=3156740 RepID=UPI0033A24775